MSSFPNDCTSPSPSDDTGILGLLNDNNSTTDYTISHFTQYWQLAECGQNKRTDLCETSHTGLNPLLIHGKTVEQVDSFTYLGLTLDNRLRFDQHITSIHTRFQQRLHVICKLRSLSVAPHLLLLLHNHYSTCPAALFCMVLLYTVNAQQKQTSQNHPYRFQYYQTSPTLTLIWTTRSSHTWHCQ